MTKDDPCGHPHRDRWKNAYWIGKLLGWKPAPAGWQEE